MFGDLGHDRSGSSPRARGACSRPTGNVLLSGLIPACAGSIGRRCRCPCALAAHPRVRGEHTHTPEGGHHLIGSSPRARGASGSWAALMVRARLIPACAGSMPGPERAARPASAHPRVRGEHHSPRGFAVVALGSSPRARGASVCDSSGTHSGRLIPACAGSMAGRSAASPNSGAHPRVRGEHAACRGDCILDRGSSPRARGA